MSLINDALKKAQKQRTGEAPPLGSMPGLGGEPAARIAKRAKPAGFNALFLRLGLSAAGLVVLIVGGYFALRSKPAAANAKAEPAKTVVAAPTTPVSPTPQASVPLTPPAPAFTLPIAAQPEPVEAKPEPAAVTPAAHVASSETKPAPTEAKKTEVPIVESPAVTAKPSGPLPKMDGKAVDYIEGLRVAGIRASTTDSKVLMNDRVYRLGDIVEREMHLKLVGITSSSLTFENEAGARYTRTF